MQNFVSLHSAKYIKNSTKKENSNRSLNKLTNETIDNQPVNVPKNYEQEQEQKKDDEKSRKSRRRRRRCSRRKGIPLPTPQIPPQLLRRRGAQTTYKPNIPPQILLQTSPKIRAQKRLACSIPLTVFTARADAVLRPPCPQGRSPSLWEGRGRFWGGTRLILKSRDGFLPSFGGIGRDFPIGAGLQSQPLCRTISTIPRINLSHFTRL